MKTLFTILTVCLFVFNGNSQVQDTLSLKQLDSIKNTQEQIDYRKSHTNFYTLRKGRIYLSWGYNRSSYGRSSIHLTGNGYDFTIKDAIAKDRPTPFDANIYFNPTLLTIPQYNLRIGYFVTNKISLTFNVDHMKYVLDNEQIATVDGYVDSSASEKWAGEYDNKLMELKKEFIGYEHTDGLNIISIEMDYNDLFYETVNRKFAVDLVAGVGLGAAVPRTNSTLFNSIGADAFHLAGGGVSANVGLKLYFFKHFYLHPTTKVGYLFMPNVATNGLEIDNASQNIAYFQGNITIGFQYKISKK